MPPLDPTPSGRALDDGQGDPCLEGTDRFGEIASSTICEIIRRRYLFPSIVRDRQETVSFDFSFPSFEQSSRLTARPFYCRSTLLLRCRILLSKRRQHFE